MQFAIVCLCTCVLLARSLAFHSFQSQIPNGNNIPHPCKVNYRWPGVGHEYPNGGGARNAFGRDFHDLGYRWSRELCAKDSDGDGKTNGEELGVCEPHDSDLCRDKNSFLSCELDKFEACNSIKQPGVMSMDVRFPVTAIPATETNYYCMTFDLPADQDYHLIAHEALIDKPNVLHHMLVYGCPSRDDQYIPVPQACGMSAGEACGEILSIWTVGQAGTCYGDNVGFRIGRSGYQRIRLEIHYNNPQLVSNYRDSSGLRLYYQLAQPQVQDLYTFMLGQAYLAIPPGRSEVEQVGVCPSDCLRYFINQPAQVATALNHMHYMDCYVYWGQGTAEEMCFAFLTIYPASAVTAPACVAFGSMSSCELYGGSDLRGCDWQTYTNLSHPESAQRFARLERECNLDGFCKPECREALTEMNEHPCLQGEPGALVKTFLSREHKGVEYLGRLHSCNGDIHTPEPQDCREECSRYCPQDTSVYSGTNKMAPASAILSMLVSVFVRLF